MIAQNQTAEAVAARKFADEKSVIAERRLGNSKQFATLLSEIFEDLDIRKVEMESRPIQAILADRLVDAAQNLESLKMDDPRAFAEVKGQLADCLLGLG
ncbi:MAG: hypothetical protein AAGA30_14495, partial [Planctomycetota bacterium]